MGASNLCGCERAIIELACFLTSTKRGCLGPFHGLGLVEQWTDIQSSGVLSIFGTVRVGLFEKGKNQ